MNKHNMPAFKGKHKAHQKKTEENFRSLAMNQELINYF